MARNGTPTLAGWKRLPGKSQRYQNVNTGKILSKRQYQKLKNKIKSKLEEPIKSRQAPKPPKFYFPSRVKPAPGRPALRGWKLRENSLYKMQKSVGFGENWENLMETAIIEAMGRGADTFSVLIKLENGDERFLTGEFLLSTPFDVWESFIPFVKNRLEEFLIEYKELSIYDMVVVAYASRDQAVNALYREEVREYYKSLKPETKRRRVA